MNILKRREFLLSLMALGASYAMSSKAKPEQVVKAWQQALEDPWYFYVDSDRTIVDPSVSQPEYWGDVFSIDPAELGTLDKLIMEVDGCDPLRDYFMSRTEIERGDLNSELDNEDLSDEEQERLSSMVEAMEDEDYGWRAWIEHTGVSRLKEFQDMISDWLSEPIDWMNFDATAPNLGGQGNALDVFEALGSPTLKLLGVRIVEGEHPGSSYNAAELHSNIDTTNAASVRLGLPIRFRELLL